MTAALLALSLSSSFTKAGAIAAFAALVGIAVMSMLFFAQARELKRLREWADEEPGRAAELEHRVSTATALRIQRATAQLARPAAPARPQPVARAAAVGAAVATQVAPGAATSAYLPAAPLALAGRAAPPAPTVLEPPVVEQHAEEQPAESPYEAEAPALVGVAAEASVAPAAARVVDPIPRAPAPPPPQRSSSPQPARQSPRRMAPPLPSQTPRRVVRRPRGGSPPGPPFLREERSSPPIRLLLLAAGAIAVVVLAIVVFASGGGSSTGTTSSSKTKPGHAATPGSSTPGESEVAASPAETHVVVLNDTETGGLAHRVAANLQQSGYTLAAPLGGKPSGSHSSSVVEYAAGHRLDARHVAQTLGVASVQPLEAGNAGLANGASVVVIAGPDLASTAATSATGSATPSEGSSEAAGGGSG